MAEDTVQKLGRRDALKIIVAGAGAITASAFLPEKWVKPVAEFGVSPVHAQASIAPAVGGTISGVVMTCTGGFIPAVGASVTATGPVTRTTTSGVGGNYTFSSIPAGSYVLTNSEAADTPTVIVTVGGLVIQDVGASGC
jgi:hypothetical protein